MRYGISRIGAARAASYGHRVGTPAHILLLTASPDESDMYAFWLQSCGYRVSVAKDRASARRLTRGQGVDVLVIDALFAPAKRAEVARRWRRLAHQHSLSIVMLSGYLPGDDRYVPGAGELCLLKPCLPHQLSGWIEQLLSRPPDRSSSVSEGKPVAAYVHP
jgi:DNA-binding response OmpR family regulator